MGVRLNLGCGGRIEGGHINVDMSAPGAQERWDVFSFPYRQQNGKGEPYPDNSVEGIIAWHVLEHASQFVAIKAVAEWSRILRKGGQLSLRVPDLLSVMGVCVARGKLIPNVMHHVYANHRDQWDVHHWAYDEHSIRNLLENHGFIVPDVVVWANHFELRVEARKR